MSYIGYYCVRRCADIAEYVSLGTINESYFDQTFSVNVRGLLFTIQKTLLLFQDSGSIILTAAVGASKGYEGFSVYGATKAAIRSFAHSWTFDPRGRCLKLLEEYEDGRKAIRTKNLLIHRMTKWKTRFQII